MTTFNTGNPIGSTDPRDLSDNSENFDRAVNDTSSPTWTDRRGNIRTTLAGQLGYNFKGDYAAGIELVSYSDIIRYNSEFYRPSASATLPYTTTATLPDVDQNLVAVGDAVLRQELAQNPSTAGNGVLLINGAVHRVSSRTEMKAYDVPAGYQFSLEEGGRSGKFVVKSGTPPSDPQEGIYVVLANGNYAERLDKSNLNVGHFGAVYSGDESVIAQAMVSLVNELRVPQGKTLTAKNIALVDDTLVEIFGTLKMPDACVDFDKALYGYNFSRPRVFVNEFDGNIANQAGTLGTHFIYFIDCTDPQVEIKYAHDHYYVVGGSVGDTDGGNRDASAGAIFLRRATGGSVKVELLSNWGREGVQIREGVGVEVYLGHAQGTESGSQYSGVQVEGTGNKLLRASVDLAKASAIGFDTQDGSASNLIATDTRENHGVNFGHTGWPASRSVVSNVVVDKARLSGIQVSAATEDLSISNFSVRNSGQYGVAVSDGSSVLRMSNGFIGNSGTANARAFGATAKIHLANTKIDSLDERSVIVNGVTGNFVEGETVTTASSSGVVRAIVKSATDQVLFITSLTGTFIAAETVTGGTSGATATVVSSSLPIDASIGGGADVFTDRFIPETGAGQAITKLPNGSAILSFGTTVSVTAGTNHVFTIPFVSTISWPTAPKAVGSVAAALTTNAYIMERLEAVATTTDIIIRLRANTSQDYTINVIAIGEYDE